MLTPTIKLLRWLHGAYSLATFIVVVLLLFCPLIIVGPTLAIRRAIGRLAVRAWLAASLVPFRVRGAGQVPATPCIALCNHASYLDGILLTAALPPHFTFLVQHRAADWPYVGLVLKRMGVRFVDRWSPRAAARATREMVDRIRAGESFAIFPEGTFTSEAGLLPFQGGAFVIAARTGVPVVPGAIRGSRRLHRDGRLLFNWHPIDIEFFAPLSPADESRAAADALRAATRAVILAHCGEPDTMTDNSHENACGEVT